MDNLNHRLAVGQLTDPIVGLLTVIKRAHEGQLFVATLHIHSSKEETAYRAASAETGGYTKQPITPSVTGHVHPVVTEIRYRLALAGG